MHVNEAAVLISEDAALGGRHCQLGIVVVRLDRASIWNEDAAWFENHQYFCGVSGNLRSDLILSRRCLALQGAEKSLEMGLRGPPEPN